MEKRILKISSTCFLSKQCNTPFHQTIISVENKLQCTKKRKLARLITIKCKTFATFIESGNNVTQLIIKRKPLSSSAEKYMQYKNCKKGLIRKSCLKL